MLSSLTFSFLCLSFATGQYVPPPWFDRIRAEFEPFVPGNVRRCFKREGVPPVPGEICAETPKTCFFGNQTCPNGELNPSIQCSCPGRPNNQWGCAPFNGCECPPPARCPAVSEVVPDNALNTIDFLTGIVDYMNDLRQSQIAGQELDPVPCRLPCLTWSEELAERALTSALACSLSVDRGLISEPPFATVGQIVSATGTLTPDTGTLLLFLYNGGRSIYDYATNTCSTTNACDFYLQLVSDQTVAVGCAAVACERIPLFPVPDSTLVYCFFGEAMVDGARPYVTAPALSTLP